MQNKILCKNETDMENEIYTFVSQFLKHNNTVSRENISHLLSGRNQSKINNNIDKDHKFVLYAEEKETIKKERYLQATVYCLIGDKKHYQCFKTFLH